MPIITVTERKECYKEFGSRLVSPYSDVNEPMTVGLYKRIITTAIIQNIKKKPIVVFYLQIDGREIPKRDWTHEMKKSAEQYAKDYLVPDAGKKYSLLGKILFSFASIGVLAAGASIFYILYFFAPRQKLNFEEFVAIPKVGDKYYGSIRQIIDENKTPKMLHGWIKIISVVPEDSIISYTTSTRLGGLTFETFDAEHNNFTTTILTGKFNARENKQKISIISSDRKNVFECQVISNETKNYKITAK
ncbi:hypothetical protein GCM10022393_42360 [Aquimarina addita]|uniref:Uncharacterized protein n=1 Tax=Aquimarina addita TaxID=870485 RepID=A0ABP6UYI9_9FLAO